MIVGSIEFTLLSPEMIKKMAVAKITKTELYDEEGYPIEGGVMDPRMGVVDPGIRCRTCGGTIGECQGHFGYIELTKPVVHVLYTKIIFSILKVICKKCSRILVEEKEIEKLREKKVSLKELVKIVKKKCPYCKTTQSKIKFIKPYTFVEGNEILNPLQIRERLEKITDDDFQLMGFKNFRPEWMVITLFPVAPVSVRPSITLETGERSEDDLTHKLVDIVRINERLKENIELGAPEFIINDLWELLQYHVSTYFDNELTGVPPARHRSRRVLKTLSQRLKTKEGRFRGNLAGKRVNFSARSVISPDPFINIDEVGVPEIIAKELTVPVKVNEKNIESIRKFVENGPNNWPGANYIVRPDGRRKKITDENKKELAKELAPGYIVERHLINGDISLFNRQPSLHRMSIMCHKVKVLDHKTFRLNPIVTVPYNADFDGDEMNLHVIETEEGKAEAHELLKVDKHILSVRHGNTIIRPNEDHVTALYFLTKDDTVFTKEQASRLLYIANIKELPKPDRENGYSGKLIFSLLLPPGINVNEKGKLGEIIIKNSKLIKGALDDKTAAQIILHQVFVKHGPEVTKNFLNALSKVALEFFTCHGFSISYHDYKPSEQGEKKIKETLAYMDNEINRLINAYKNKVLELLPGMSLKQSFERSVMNLTSKIREDIGVIVEKDLGDKNPAIVMAKIGTRGNILNAIQMTAVVAQQAIRNKRPYRGFHKRVLSCFKKGELSARARGFVYSSFSKGLQPDEFFMHSMGGRDSIVNKGIRTSRSGYMQRKLINALQDLIVHDDFSVRDSSNNIIQPIYGGDMKDPTFSAVKEIEEMPREDDVDTATA